MRLPYRQIEQCAGVKDSREYLKHVYLDVEKKELTACDGHIVAIINAELDDGDSTGYLTLPAIKAARSKNKYGAILANCSQVIPGGPTFERPTVESIGQYPDVMKVIPSKPEGDPTIVLDVELLMRLAKALNPKCSKRPGVLALWINGAGDIVYVESADGQARGAIMPIRR